MTCPPAQMSEVSFWWKGYKSEFSCVLMNIDQDFNTDALCVHERIYSLWKRRKNC